MTRHGCWFVVVMCGAMLSAQASSLFAQQFDKSRVNAWLQTLDKDDDGFLDEEELKSRQAYMLRGMIRENKALDTSKPIPIEDILKAAEERSRNRDGDRRRDEDRDRRGDSERRDEDRRDDERRGDPDRERETRRDDEKTSIDREDSGLSDKELRRREAISKLNLRSSYKFSDRSANLPDGVPEWFEERDANGDGQIRMSEFATEWTKPLLEEFAEYDRNRDGVITPQECIDLEEKGPLDLPERVASYSRLGSTPRDRDRDRSKGPASRRSSGSSRSRDKNAAIMKYVDSIYASYDKNKDDVLSEDEVAAMSSPPKDADTDGDGKITKEEFAETQK